MDYIKTKKDLSLPMIKKRDVEIEVAGLRSHIAVPLSMSKQDLQLALDYTYSMLCQTCYMEYTVADNFMIIASDVLKKKKALRFGVKKNFLDLQKAIRSTMRTYEQHMNEGYYNEYSTVLYEKVAPLIEKLRKVIEDKLRNLQCKRNAYICSYVIMIQNLVQQVNDTYTHVMDVVMRKYGVKFHDSFKRLRCIAGFKAADNLLYAFMQDEADKFANNIVKNKDVIAIWSKISMQLYDMKNVTDARFEAYYAMPEEQQQKYELHADDGYCELKQHN